MTTANHQRILQLQQERTLPEEEWQALFDSWDESDRAFAAQLANQCRQEHFGNRIFVRGIVEYSNCCKNDCLYCGLRASNSRCQRYRLDESTILQCCGAGYEYGFRTFVLQGGEDGLFPAERIAQITAAIRRDFPDCAITLSAGEMSRDEYALLKGAGADRYLLRHESANCDHYASLHAPNQSWQHRMDCLHSLKELGFQTGCGFMVGAPGQTTRHLVEEMLFLRRFQPHMVGIGPFIPHGDTPFANQPAGDAKLTLFLLSLIRLQHPRVLLPATTALATLLPNGRSAGVLAGANVIMPNLSPEEAVRKYRLYDNMKTDQVQGTIMDSPLQRAMEEIGCTIHISRGDYTAGEALQQGAHQ